MRRFLSGGEKSDWKMHRVKRKNKWRAIRIVRILWGLWLGRIIFAKTRGKGVGRTMGWEADVCHYLGSDYIFSNLTTKCFMWLKSSSLLIEELQTGITEEEKRRWIAIRMALGWCWGSSEVVLFTCTVWIVCCSFTVSTEWKEDRWVTIFCKEIEW